MRKGKEANMQISCTYESYITQEGYTMMLSILTTGEVQIYAKEAVKSSFFLRKVMSY